MVVFINTTIIKQNNMTCQHKVIFYIWDEFEYGFGVDTYIPVTNLCFEIEENPYPDPNSIKMRKTCQIGFGSGG